MYIESQKDPNSQCTLEGGKMNKAGDITLPNFLISKHITKLQKSEQYGTGIKTDIQTNGTKWRA